jgi:hypothetical protein
LARIVTQPTLNKRDNSLLISFCVNRPLISLLKDTRPFNVSMKVTLKYSFFVSLITFNNVNRVLFFINLIYNICLYISILINSSLITLKYHLLVFIRLIVMVPFGKER